MIAHVRGEVAALSLDSAVIDVGGIGHHVYCTPGTIARLRLGETAQLSTSLVVREDSLTLYGFADTDERDMFVLVQTASGVGPKVAQAMLAVLPPDRLRRAIAEADHAALTSVPGIGRKGAERIVVELKDRVGPAPATTSGPAGSPAAWRPQVREALQGLGWSERDADKALDAVASSVGDDPDVGQVLRLALRSLSKA
jgi:Holliday junction DNA helicase RuvA